MKKNVLIISLLCCFGFAVPSAAQGKETREWTVLDGRLKLVLPEPTVRFANPSALMDAPAPQERKTSLHYKKDGKSAEIVVTELFSLCRKGYPESELKLMKGLENNMGPCTFGQLNGAIAFACKKNPPVLKPENRDSTLYYYAMANVRHDDGCMLRLEFYFNDKFAEDHEACLAFCNNAINSIKSGPRRLDLSARTITLPTLNKNLGLEFDIPEGYAFYTDEGQGFFRTNFIQMVERGNYYNTFHLFLGDHPGKRSKELDLDNSDAVSEVKATLLGKSVTWYIFDCDEGEDILAEALLPMDKTQGPGIYLLLTVCTSDIADAQKIIKLFDSLKYKPSAAKNSPN